MCIAILLHQVSSLRLRLLPIKYIVITGAGVPSGSPVPSNSAGLCPVLVSQMLNGDKTIIIRVVKQLAAYVRALRKYYPLYGKPYQSFSNLI